MSSAIYLRVHILCTLLKYFTYILLPKVTSSWNYALLPLVFYSALCLYYCCFRLVRHICVYLLIFRWNMFPKLGFRSDVKLWETPLWDQAVRESCHFSVHRKKKYMIISEWVAVFYAINFRMPWGFSRREHLDREIGTSFKAKNICILYKSI